LSGSIATVPIVRKKGQGGLSADRHGIAAENTWFADGLPGLLRLLALSNKREAISG
jgi:hypothetical protein